jgi:hypothetical protein
VTALPKVASAAEAGITDTNAYLGTWPFRQLLGEQPAALSAALHRNGIRAAWVASFAGLFHRDLAAVNAGLVEACRSVHDEMFVPVGSINPMLPAWRDDVKRCAQQHGMKVIRLHPNYHGYPLDAPIFVELLAFAAEHQLRVQIFAQMEDERTHSQLVQVKPLNLKPLPAVLKQVTGARVMVLNANALMITTALQGCSDVWLDFAMIEGVGGVENLLKAWPGDKLCFGSFAPLFYPESSVLKLQESELSAAQLAQLTHANAAAFLS